jgi:hypothetical protein
MLDLKENTFSDLIDMLSSHTATYMSMLRSGASREQFEQCRDEIRLIQVEIEARKTQRHSDIIEGTDSSVTLTQSA